MDTSSRGRGTSRATQDNEQSIQVRRRREVVCLTSESDAREWYDSASDSLSHSTWLSLKEVFLQQIDNSVPH